MQEDLYINLIYKKLSGEITPQEVQNLDSWLEAAEENKQTYAAITTAWETSGQLKPKVNIDLDQAFADLEEQIDQDEKSEAIPVKPIDTPVKRMNAWAIAATLLVLVGSFFIFKNFLDNDNVVKLVEVQTQDQIREITLSDGSVITLNKNSFLQYPEEFTGQERKVTLKGEAFFEVQHDPKNPFSVHFNQQQVKVLGTSFNINMDDNNTAVGVFSGKVNWTTAATDNILTKGMLAIRDHKTGVLTTSKNSATNIAHWKKNQLLYEERSLDFVFNDLGRIFDIQFSPLPDHLKSCQFTSTFDELSLDNIISTLSTVFGMEINKINAGYYKISGGACQ